MSYIFETIIHEENLKPKYKMNVITKDGINYEELYFTSLTDFKYFFTRDEWPFDKANL